MPPPVASVVLYGNSLKSRVSTQQSPTRLKVTPEATKDGGKDTVTKPRGVNTFTENKAIAYHL